jgi:hypothetical protein
LDEWESTWEPTRKAASVGLVALRNLVNGDRYQSARALEKNISMLKEAARTEDLPQLRDVSQGLAAMALKRVQAKVDQTMATAHYPGWDESSGQPSPALTNLQAGRKATAQKYDIQDRFKPLMGGKPPQQVEPVQAFGRMVWGGDTGIRNLQRVAEVAPDQMPRVGRAFIDSDGKWNQLGPETKKVLFKDPNVIEGLDKYYELHQKYGNLRDMEPAALYNKMTSEGQGRLEFLNDIASRAPDQMPLVERAYFQGLLDTLTRKGDISNLESTFNSYLNMDPRVKRIMINDPARTRDWDSFFYALREMMNNPNPSGSGFMFGINQLKSKVTTGVTMGLGGLVGGLHGGAPGAGAGAGLGLVGSGVLDIVSNAALARLMMNDRLRRMLIRGMEEQNRGNLPAARLAARTVSQMVQNEPPEDPHGGPPGGGDVPSAGGGAPPSSSKR